MPARQRAFHPILCLLPSTRLLVRGCGRRRPAWKLCETPVVSSRIPRQTLEGKLDGRQLCTTEPSTCIFFFFFPSPTGARASSAVTGHNAHGTAACESALQQARLLSETRIAQGPYGSTSIHLRTEAPVHVHGHLQHAAATHQMVGRVESFPRPKAAATKFSPDRQQTYHLPPAPSPVLTDASPICGARVNTKQQLCSSTNPGMLEVCWAHPW